ncbi:ketoacyl-ACP synthase III [bacterium]|nr:ketoacyl-ACP synthase III [bacterium]
MYINSTGYYIPSERVTNSHFSKKHGLTEEWFLARTGIEERSKASPGEDTQTMGKEAVKKAIEGLPYSKDEIGLIVGATYTPKDTIVTLAHSIQNYLDIDEVPVVTISAACSSLINAIEIVEGYFAMGKASKALVIASEHNTAYSNEEDPKAGHLWGDGAFAICLSKERVSDKDFLIKEIITKGAGNVGKASIGVGLNPSSGGFDMKDGRDVFINACQYMAQVTQEIVERNGYSLDDIAYLIPHQANLRITQNVLKQLGLPTEKGISNIQYLGNTGSAGCGIAFSENVNKFKSGDKIVFTVFGGGYSYGAMLVEK